MIKRDDFHPDGLSARLAAAHALHDVPRLDGHRCCRTCIGVIPDGIAAFLIQFQTIHTSASLEPMSVAAPKVFDADPSKMLWVPGGDFQMGSDHHYPEEAPRHPVRVDGFWIDAAPVTNREFAAFIDDTGHVTGAEIAPDPKDYPGALPEMCKPGSLLFTPTDGPVDLRNWAAWWRFELGINWRCPQGLGTDWRECPDHPVVHVTHVDAAAYARWKGKQLPTEAEWEYAAWGGTKDVEFQWGDELEPGGEHRANVWQGQFPWQNAESDGFARTSPVGAYRSPGSSGPGGCNPPSWDRGADRS